jgi:hypothetical protein
MESKDKSHPILPCQGKEKERCHFILCLPARFTLLLNSVYFAHPHVRCAGRVLGGQKANEGNRSEGVSCTVCGWLTNSDTLSGQFSIPKTAASHSRKVCEVSVWKEKDPALPDSVKNVKTDLKQWKYPSRYVPRKTHNQIVNLNNVLCR